MYEQWIITGLLALLAYLLGAIPTGFLLAKVKGIDIRTVGSGNIGATNVYRCVGKSWGILTFALDFLKGYLPAAMLPLLIRHMTWDNSAAIWSMIFGCLAVAGHNWPIYLRFRGGKGMATGAGALLGFAPLAMLLGVTVWGFIFLATRYVSLASVLAAGITATAAWPLYWNAKIISAILTLMSLLIIWRHRSNIRRLRAGVEYRFEFRKKAQCGKNP